ncbi:nucleotidyl transferase AbiEii/AbiGii toxin family protein [Phycicoccus avicenniae]|uniref:nucleotidyl transferase AbiEii/AbiGii toxin family protein n=1 Tax=Phycicoccus avicenniae TaxID=2828860 RepID=UPI003D270279
MTPPAADGLQKRPRATVEVATPVGGWPPPWPNVAELAAVLPADRWTLVGGLMTQLHTAHHGIGVVRPTNDVDVVLHVETIRGVPDATATALEGLGYRLRETVDPRNNTAHRFVRGTSNVDVVSGAADGDVVDVLMSDHAAPAVVERLRGRDMVRIEGGTQALRRTMNAVLEITDAERRTISVPSPLGAVILKAAAYATDSRDRDRHLFDAAALLACIADPFADRDDLRGSDRRRLTTLRKALSDDHPAWRQLPRDDRANADAALRILLSDN